MYSDNIKPLSINVECNSGVYILFKNQGLNPEILKIPSIGFEDNTLCQKCGPSYGREVIELPHKGLVLGIGCVKIATYKSKHSDNLTHKKDSSRYLRIHNEPMRVAKFPNISIYSYDADDMVLAVGIEEALKFKDLYHKEKFMFGTPDPSCFFDDVTTIKREELTREDLENKLSLLRKSLKN